MFEQMRKMIGPIIVTVLVFFVAMIVLEWGLDFTSRNQSGISNAAVVVNGDEVSWQAYNQTYNNMYRQQSEQSDAEVTEAMEKQIQASAVEQIVFEAILEQEARKHNIVVSDDELYAFMRYSPPADLQKIPDFQTNGQFDYQKYMAAMTNPQYQPFWSQTEPFVRADLRKYKVQEMVVEGAQVTEAEIKDKFITDHEKVKVVAAIVDYGRFSGPNLVNTEQEQHAWFEQNKDKYKLDERAVADVMLIEKKPTEADWQGGQAKLKVVYDSIVAGTDFAEMARRYSEDGSAQSGGDLGWFPVGKMVAEFNQRAFSMKEGELSEPFRTQFGWHIIKHHGFRDMDTTILGKKTTRQQAHCSHILVRVNMGRDAMDLAYKQLESFRDAAAKDGVTKAATDAGLTPRRTEPFQKGRNIPYIGSDPRASEWVFNNQPGAISEIMENNSSLFVVAVTERRPAGPSEFAEAQKKLDQDLLVHKVSTLCRDTAQAMLNAVNGGMSLQDAAKRYAAKYEELDEFGRTTYVQAVHNDPAAIGAAFALTTPGQISKVVDYDQGSVVYKLVSRTSPELSDYNAKRDSVYNLILTSKRQELFGRWFDSMKKNAKIENNLATAEAQAAGS
jgi:peptidyl-prolyl cis-trans isomerase D